jgi:hypothetical protein
MAIIRQPSSGVAAQETASLTATEIESIIFSTLRPAILVQDGTFAKVDGPDSELLEKSRQLLEAALRAVGRIEIDDDVMPWIGTAFLIDRKWAVTANFVAEILREKYSDGTGEKLKGVWLNLNGEFASKTKTRIALAGVVLVHPYWGFAFLELQEEVADTTALPLQIAPSPQSVSTDQSICVIGFPARDAREAPELVDTIFQMTFDVKRIMPGKILGTSRWGREDSFVLQHDATTMSGTSGAPVIDLASGQVIGMHIGGQAFVANYAVPAWEFNRDPAWTTRLKAGAQATSTDVKATRRELIIEIVDAEPILTYDELNTVFQLLIRGGMTDEKIRALQGGIPQEYASAFPRGDNPATTLSLMLDDMNETGGKIREHHPLYYVLSNFQRLYAREDRTRAQLDTILEELRHREALLA